MNKIYENLCEMLINKGEKVENTLEVRNVQFTLKDINENIITNRNISYEYILGELIWYFTGSNDVNFISKFGSLWKKISDDGKTNNSAYGYILKRKFKFDQIEKIIDLLSKDKNSRRAVLNINTPNFDVIDTKDEPCTIAIQYLIRDGKLNCTTFMRSNDIYYGLPYDAIFFTELQKHVANRLGLEYGEWTHFATSLHVYERDIDKIKNLKNDKISYKVNIEKLISNCYSLYVVVDKNNIMKYAIDWGILY